MHLLKEHTGFYWKHKCLWPNAVLLLRISSHYFYLYTVPPGCLFDYEVHRNEETRSGWRLVWGMIGFFLLLISCCWGRTLVVRALCLFGWWCSVPVPVVFILILTVKFTSYFYGVSESWYCISCGPGNVYYCVEISPLWPSDLPFSPQGYSFL